MPTTIHPYTTKPDWLALRALNVNSTEVAALFNASPYLTYFELWHRKRNAEIVQLEKNERMKWGRRLQNEIAHGVAEDNGWTIRRMDEYMVDDGLRLGASFDFRILREIGHMDGNSHIVTDPAGDRTTDSLLEIKNVDALQFREGWISEGDYLEAPVHIELQVQTQLAVSGLRDAYLAALVGGNRVVLIRREREENIISTIHKKVAEFWKSVDSGIEPQPDFSKDADFFTKLHSYAEPGKVIRADEEVGELAGLYKELSDNIKEGTQARDEIKAKILSVIGDAEKVAGDKFTISAGMVGPAHVEYDRAGYRMFKVSWRKTK